MWVTFFNTRASDADELALPVDQGLGHGAGEPREQLRRGVLGVGLERHERVAVEPTSISRR